MWILLIIILILIIGLNIFVFLIGIKLNHLEKNIINIFKKRNNQVISVYQISKNYLTKHDEIFKNFIELKRKDFLDNTIKIDFKNKLVIYKEIHNEINFIFKICEQNKKLNLNSKYLYIKDSILDKSNEIGKNIKVYNKIKNEYDYLKKITNITLLGLLIK